MDEDKRKFTITVSLDRYHLDSLHTLCELEGLNRSEMLRQLIREAIIAEEKAAQ